MRALALVSCCLLFATSVERAAAAPIEIVVAGEGVVSSAPDRVTLKLTLRGEGPDPDAATAQVARVRNVLENELPSVGGHFSFTTGDMDFSEARSAECEDAGYGGARRLSTGPCAVIGYVVSTTLTVRTDAVDKAGTLIGFAGRLGAIGAEIDDFDLEDDTDARGRAANAAILDATNRAQAIARGAKVKLGRIVRVQDQKSADLGDAAAITDIMVTAQRIAVKAPVEVKVVPEPIKTMVNLDVTYEAAE